MRCRTIPFVLALVLIGFNAVTNDTSLPAPNYLSRIVVKGLWGVRDIDIPLKRSINIFIGHNGSGKTTILNIVADILTLDFDALSKIEFKRVFLQFEDASGQPSAMVSVSSIYSDSKFVDGYTIHVAGEKDGRGINETQKVSFSYKGSNSALNLLYQNTFSRTVAPVNSEIARFLTGLSTLTWVSVHRKLQVQRHELQASVDDAIDSRIEHLNVRYAELIRKIEAEIAEEGAAFQKALLTSLMLTLPPKNLKNSQIKNLRIDDIQASMMSISTEFQLEKETTKIERVLSELRRVISLFHSGAEITNYDRTLGWHGTQLADVSEEWKLYRLRTQALMLRRWRLPLTLDRFFTDKDSRITKSSGIVFMMKSDNHTLISPKMLSSGEKQVYLLLMEAALQEGAPAIFIADEPELSLHILWQEKLVQAISDLNESAQLIFATHSPDLVANHGNAVFDFGSDQAGLIDSPEFDWE